MQLQPSDPDIQTIVSRIRGGDLDLQPEFQRGEVWPIIKKKRLVDSILRKWHVPPIHVVVEEDGRQVVLDGQQRLASIRDFVNGAFKIDGKIEPPDPSIKRLDGLRYDELPPDVRRAFDQFTIRVFRLTEYSPEEPGELFFRLNQMTYLTSAEQRNAFFGPVRQQIKDLVLKLEVPDSDQAIGFSNRRMAYDDVIAKVLCTLEVGTLAKKLSSGEISNRFRSAAPFDAGHFNTTAQSISLLNRMLKDTGIDARFNKATLFTWLIFLSWFAKQPTSPRSYLNNFLVHFNRQREEAQSGLMDETVFARAWPASQDFVLMRIYLDRSSSRVSDVSSVILRDFVVWALFSTSGAREIVEKILGRTKCNELESTLQMIAMQPSARSEIGVERHINMELWGSLSAIG